MYASQVLARFVAGLEGVRWAEQVRTRVADCVLDVLGAAAAAHAAPAVAGWRDSAALIHAQGSAPVWFSGLRLSAAGAVTCNSAAASMLDLDDGNRAARGHPGAAVIPAALAAAAEAATSADEFVTAVVAGYEVGVRVAHARDVAFAGRPASRQSGRWCGYAAVAAAGRLRRTPPEQLAHAFAIAGVTAPNQEANGSSGYSRLTGNDVKEGIAWSASSGVMALQLAEAGLTGPLDLLDHESHFAQAPLLEGLDVGRPKILDTYFKPYSCCRYNHAALDAFCALLNAHSIDVNEIEAVEVHTFGWALQLGNKLEPQTLTDVQYSIPYCLGLAAVMGVDALIPVTDNTLHHPEVSAFARKVILYQDAALDTRFPAETLARVVVRTSREGYESAVTTPRGEPSNPLSSDELRRKFLTVTRHTLSGQQQQSLLSAVGQLAQGELQPLLDVLTKSLRN